MIKILDIELKTRKDKYGVEHPCSGKNLEKVIQLIKEISKDKIDKLAHDEGTCVLGAGIKINFLLTRERTARSFTLFRAPFQGNIGSYKALKPVLEYLKKEFPELKFYWDDGIMD